jgi:hypothetical protein
VANSLPESLNVKNICARRFSRVQLQIVQSLTSVIIPILIAVELYFYTRFHIFKHAPVVLNDDFSRFDQDNLGIYWSVLLSSVTRRRVLRIIAVLLCFLLSVSTGWYYYHLYSASGMYLDSLSFMAHCMFWVHLMTVDAASGIACCDSYE